MPLWSADRLIPAAFLCLLVLAGSRLLNRSTGDGAADEASAAPDDACIPDACHPLHWGCRTWTAAAAPASAAPSQLVLQNASSSETAPAAGGAAGLSPGPGSRLDDASVVAALRAVIRAHRVRTLLQYPCGDMGRSGPVIAAVQEWSPPTPAYLGTDPDSAIVDANLMHFDFARKGWRFRWVDPARRWHAFPATFDLFLLRGGFGDGSPDAVASVLQRVVESNATLLLVDSYSGRSSEKPPLTSEAHGGADSGDGPGLHVDLLQPPFGLPLPLEVFDAAGVREELHLYRMADLHGLTFGRTAG